MPTQLGDNRRPLYITEQEAEWLKHLILALGDDEHRLIPLLEHIFRELRDAKVKLDECVAVSRANAFWMEPENAATRHRMKKLKEGKKSKKNRHLKADEGMPAMTPKQVKKMLKEKRRREEKERVERIRLEAGSRVHVVADANVDLVEDAEQGGVGHAEQDGGTGPAVLGDEAQHLEVLQRNGQVGSHGDAEAPLP